MFTVTKSADRLIKTQIFINSVKTGAPQIQFKTIDRFIKWKELDGGSKISVKFDLIRFYNPDNKATAYILSDSFDRLACIAHPDLEEIHAWLIEHGYKAEKDFYIQDYGMSEETWNEWNTSND